MSLSATKRRTARGAIAGVVVLVVTAVFGGIAWGVSNITKARRVDAVATYYVKAPPGAGEQWVQLLNLGGVIVSAYCGAEYFDPATDPGYPYGVGMGGGIFVTNNTTQRIVVTSEPRYDDDLSWNDYMWLEPGQEDPVFGVGQWVNEQNATDLGRAEVWTFAILSHGGASVTGTLARSAAVDPGDPTTPGDEMGECVFSIQARG